MEHEAKEIGETNHTKMTQEVNHLSSSEDRLKLISQYH
jgi:hypothetical protein